MCSLFPLQELKQRQIAVEKEIFEFLPIEQGRQKILLEAMNYSNIHNSSSLSDKIPLFTTSTVCPPTIP